MDVTHDEIEQERALTRARLADDPNVALTLLTPKDNTAAVRSRRN
jgi:hypothetical protein